MPRPRQPAATRARCVACRFSSAAWASLQPTTVTDSSGRTLALTMTGTHITSIAAPGSRTYGYGYDGSGNLTSYTDPAGVATQYGYDGSHRLKAITLDSGHSNVVTTLTYDTSNRLVALVDPMSYDVGITYGAAGTRQTTVQQLQTNSTTTPATSNSVYEVTTYTGTADGSGAIASINDPLGQTTAFVYNMSAERSLGYTIALACVTILIAGSALLLFAIEGIVCLAMAAPIAIVLAVIGSILAT